jgi:hypothetical protein
VGTAGWEGGGQLGTSEACILAGSGAMARNELPGTAGWRACALCFAYLFLSF